MQRDKSQPKTDVTQDRLPSLMLLSAAEFGPSLRALEREAVVR